jgi:hypothetical protein
MIPHMVISLVLRNVNLGVQRRNLSPQNLEIKDFRGMTALWWFSWFATCRK